jgi:uncharacterized protein (DUF433 family)
MTDLLLSRITSDPAIFGGKPITRAALSTVISARWRFAMAQAALVW